MARNATTVIVPMLTVASPNFAGQSGIRNPCKNDGLQQVRVSSFSCPSGSFACTWHLMCVHGQRARLDFRVAIDILKTNVYPCRFGSSRQLPPIPDAANFYSEADAARRKSLENNGMSLYL